MDKLFAVVSLTYKEVLRKRIFLIVVLFTIILISATAFFPVVGSAERIRLVEIWTLRGISFFGMIIAIFLAAVSLPSDIEYRRVFSVFTKPINKETFILGKFLGFVLVMALFVFALGLIGLIYLKIVDFISAPGKSYVTAPVERIKPVEFRFHQRGGTAEELRGSYQNAEEQLKVTLKGRGKHYGLWRFKNLEPDQLTDPIRCELTARIMKELMVSANISLVFHNPLTKYQETRRARLTYKKPLIVEFNKSCIDPTGRLWVRVFSLEPEAELTLQPNSLVVLTAPRSFTWNFIKSLGLIFLQIVLILAIMIAGSTVLSGSVNAFLGIFIYFIGSGMGFFQESLVAMERRIEIEEQKQVQSIQYTRPSSDTFPLWMMKTSKSILNSTFMVIPNLAEFDGTTPLLKGIPIKAGLISSAFSYLLLYVIIALIIGWFCFRWREFK